MPRPKIHRSASARVMASQLKHKQKVAEELKLAAAARSILDAMRGRAELGDSSYVELIVADDAITLHNLAIDIREAPVVQNDEPKTFLKF